jgi:hypothetical protein
MVWRTTKERAMPIGVMSHVPRPLHAAAMIALAVVASCDVNVEVNVDDGDDVAGSGTIVSERREVADVDRVVLEGEGTIDVTEGDAESLTVTTDDNLLEHIEVTIDDGTLEIRTASGIDIEPTTSVVYELEVIEIDGIELAGVGTIEMAEWSTGAGTVRLSGVGDVTIDELAADDVNVDHSGVGDVTIDELVADDLTVDHSGVGNVTVAGRVDEQDVSITGVGDYRAGDLASRLATIDASGPTESTVWVTDSLDVSVGGPATVGYFGDAEVDDDVSREGTLTALGPR